MGIAYGVNIVDDNDRYVQLAKDASYAVSNGGPPGATGVDIFPFGMLLFHSKSFSNRCSPFSTPMDKLASLLEICTATTNRHSGNA